MEHRLIPGAFVALVALSVHAACAQDEPAQGVVEVAPEPLTISPDRPGFYEGVTTVPALHMQLEAGFAFTTDNSADSRSWVLPQATLRFGVTDWGEVFVDVPSWARTDQDGFDGPEGMTDLLVGFKARLFDQSGARPALSFVGEMGIPTGDNPFTNGGPSPRGVVAAKWDLPGGFGFVVNGAFGYPGDGDDEHSIQTSAAVALEIPVADGVGAYVEYYGLYRANGGPPPEHYADGGFTFLLTRRVQLDVSMTVGLNAHSADVGMGAGIAILF